MKPIEFGQYLRKLRKEKKLTVRQLDLYSDVSHSYISQMERGARGVPSPEILEKLAKPLGVEYEELMRKAGYIKEPDPELSAEEKRQVLEFISSNKDFINTIDLSDDELFDKYSFTYEGEKLDDEVVKLLRSYVRFLLHQKH